MRTKMRTTFRRSAIHHRRLAVAAGLGETIDHSIDPAGRRVTSRTLSDSKHASRLDTRHDLRRDRMHGDRGANLYGFQRQDRRVPSRIFSRVARWWWWNKGKVSCTRWLIPLGALLAIGGENLSNGLPVVVEVGFHTADVQDFRPCVDRIRPTRWKVPTIHP